MVPDTAARQDWMSRLACADPDELSALWAATGRSPEFAWLRAPEIGTVMVRGRAGGTGAPFNLGEITVTRCALKLSDGTVGHAVTQGRDKDKARIAALVDALMQTGDAVGVRAGIVDPLAEAAHRGRKDRAEKAAATKVDFFTMVRGED